MFPKWEHNVAQVPGVLAQFNVAASHVQIQGCSTLETFQFQQGVFDVWQGEWLPLCSFIQFPEVCDEPHSLILFGDDC